MNYTKAQMLGFLKEKVPEINILPMYSLNSAFYFADRQKEALKICDYFKGEELIVRSSAEGEDTCEWSNAGAYKSILHVKCEPDSVRNAIEDVYASYQTDQEEEILIQPMLKHVIKSGVVFTADIETMAEYYILNYTIGSDTETVTGGKNGVLRTFIAYKFAEIHTEDEDIKNLLSVCKRIEKALGQTNLDIEFAVSSEHDIYIFQVRPIAKGDKPDCLPANLHYPLERIYKKAQKLSKPHPFLLGKTTCFGVMPDWNPAEILGIRPKKLAISLYKELVTDHIWANQRSNYGYRDLTMHPLMVSFCGIPYIDTRITFNSFIPANLNETIADKLVNYYLERLVTFPVYHDKIEFEIVFSCYYLGLPEKLKTLLDYGFNQNEVKRIEYSLLQLTNKIIHPERGLYKKDIMKTGILEDNYIKIVRSDLPVIDKIYWLIEECKAFGTLPFAGVARAGFIAVQFLHSFAEVGIISRKDQELFLNSLETVNKTMRRDWKQYKEGVIRKEEFLSRYGHIRPGTYDILSPRYDEKFDEYFELNDDTESESWDKNEGFSFSDQILNKIQVELEQNGIEVTAKELLVFIKEAIEGREYLKFVFTKSVSQILKLIKELGDRVGIDHTDMAYLDVSVVKQLYVDLFYGDIKTIFNENICNNKLQYECARQIKLPSMIVKPEDVYYFHTLLEEPNFITLKRVVAETAILSENDQNIEGKIVLIQSADPGYDFLFTKNIAGLITEFGGANSHMAIRCAELGIPAVIGAGEQNYNTWKMRKKLEIDCGKKQVINLDLLARLEEL